MMAVICLSKRVRIPDPPPSEKNLSFFWLGALLKKGGKGRNEGGKTVKKKGGNRLFDLLYVICEQPSDELGKKQTIQPKRYHPISKLCPTPPLQPVMYESDESYHLLGKRTANL